MPWCGSGWCRFVPARPPTDGSCGRAWPSELDPASRVRSVSGTQAHRAGTSAYAVQGGLRSPCGGACQITGRCDCLCPESAGHRLRPFDCQRCVRNGLSRTGFGVWAAVLAGRCGRRGSVAFPSHLDHVSRGRGEGSVRCEGGIGPSGVRPGRGQDSMRRPAVWRAVPASVAGWLLSAWSGCGCSAVIVSRWGIPGCPVHAVTSDETSGIQCPNPTGV